MAVQGSSPALHFACQRAALTLQWRVAISFSEVFMVEQSREVDQAVSALTAEILKLSPLEGDAQQALSVTIENAFTRLVLAILAQSSQNQEARFEEVLEEALPAT
jgi:hypothetical protein